MCRLILFFIGLIAVVCAVCWLKSFFDPVSEHEQNGCVCKEFTCGCCLTMTEPKIKLNDTGCVKLSYLPKDYGISATLTIDDKTIIHETVSARNPLPICIDAPYMDDVMHICLRFYDLKVTKALFHACVQIEIRMLHILSVKEWKIGCFDLDLKEEVKHLKNLYKVSETNTNSSELNYNSLIPNSALNMLSGTSRMTFSKVQSSCIGLLVTFFIPYVFW